MPKSHIHFGAGKLGLGLVIPVANRLGLDTTVVSRQPSTSDKKYEVKRQKLSILAGRKSFEVQSLNTGECAHAQISEFLDWEDDTAVAERLADPGIELVTTALGKNGLPRVVQTLERGLALRQERGIATPLAVVACENIEHASSSLRDSCTSVNLQHIRFLDSIVDKVCLEPHIQDNRVFVPVADRESWEVDVSSCRDCLPSWLDEPISPVLSREAFNMRFARKATLVNGLHLAIAVYGCSKGPKTLLSGIVRNPLVRRKLDVLVEAFSIGLQCLAWSSLSEEEDQDEQNLYSLEALRGFATNFIKDVELMPDDVNRILKDLLNLKVAHRTEEAEKKESTTQSDAEYLEAMAVRRALAPFINVSTFLEKAGIRVCQPIESLLTADKRVHGSIFAQDRSGMAQTLVEWLTYLVRLIEQEFSEFRKNVTDP